MGTGQRLGNQDRNRDGPSHPCHLVPSCCRREASPAAIPYQCVFPCALEQRRLRLSATESQNAFTLVTLNSYLPYLSTRLLICKKGKKLAFTTEVVLSNQQNHIWHMLRPVLGPQLVLSTS